MCYWPECKQGDCPYESAEKCPYHRHNNENKPIALSRREMVLLNPKEGEE